MPLSHLNNEPKKFIVKERELKEFQLACAVGKDATKADIANLNKKVVAAANKCTTTKSAKNNFSTPTHLGKNLTPPAGRVSLYAVLLNTDTITIGQFAYS